MKILPFSKGYSFKTSNNHSFLNSQILGLILKIVWTTVETFIPNWYVLKNVILLSCKLSWKSFRELLFIICTIYCWTRNSKRDKISFHLFILFLFLNISNTVRIFIISKSFDSKGCRSEVSTDLCPWKVWEILWWLFSQF